MKRPSIYSREHRALAALLHDLRLEAGLSQREVGDAVGLPQTKVSALEVGRRGLYFLFVRDLAALYGITMPKLSELLEERLANPSYRPPRLVRADRKADVLDRAQISETASLPRTQKASKAARGKAR